MPDGYAHPGVLVDTVWVGDHLQDPAVRVAEVSEDVTLYDQGHIPGAVHFNWQTQLQDRVRRDWIAKEQFENLLGAYGIEEPVLGKVIDAVYRAAGLEPRQPSA